MAGKRSCVWYTKVVLMVLLFSFGTRVAALYLLYCITAPGDKSIMVATIPEGMELAVLASIAVIALIVCVGTFIWRYAEYNAAKGETRLSNKMSPKFFGALILALALTIYLAYFLAAPLVDILKIVEPTAADYITLGGFAAIFLSIGTVILFSEGFNGLAKFLAQGVKNAQSGAEQLIEELERARAELAELKRGDEEDDFPNSRRD